MAPAIELVEISAGLATFIVKTSRLLIPFTLSVDMTVVLSGLASAQRALDVTPGTHAVSFFINHGENGWSHAFSIQPSAGPEIPVDEKSEAAGDDPVTALPFDLEAS